jgi:hypothetical protein
MKHKPTCLAIIICNNVVEDVRTHNKTIIDSFNRIWGQKFPCIHPKMTVFISLTDGRGENDVRVQVLRETENGFDNKPIAMTEGKVRFTNPLDVADIVIDILGLPFKEPGLYAVQLLVNGEIIGERRIGVEQGKMGA